jgi:hypothetical protein
LYDSSHAPVPSSASAASATWNGARTFLCAATATDVLLYSIADEECVAASLSPHASSSSTELRIALVASLPLTRIGIARVSAIAWRPCRQHASSASLWPSISHQLLVAEAGLICIVDWTRAGGVRFDDFTVRRFLWSGPAYYVRL